MQKLLTSVLMVLVCFFTFAEANAQSIREVKASYSHTTGRSFDSAHGTQIEYLSAGGKAYLWYPGNSAVVKGDWKVGTHTVSGIAFSTLCFRYGRNTFNPSTGARGGEWQCSLVDNYERGIVERIGGDPFRLSQRQSVPAVLGKVNYSFAFLKKELGI